MKANLLGVLTITLLSFTSANADVKCNTRELGAQLACVQENYEKTEDALNKAYSVTAKSLSSNPDALKRLRESERGWVYFRGSQCEMISYALQHGSHLIVSQALCTVDANLSRIEFLNHLPKSSQSSNSVCKEADDQRQVACLQNQMAESDAALNTVFQKIINELENKQNFGNETNFIFENMATFLRASERSWIYYRAVQCDLVSYMNLESEDVTHSQMECTVKMNKDRMDSIKSTFTKYLKKEL
jgi:uncharacterized protein YecT (DUF1311 family)